MLRADDGRRAAARRLGERLGASVLGEPIPIYDEM
jgi:hypothetical protein